MISSEHTNSTKIKVVITVDNYTYCHQCRFCIGSGEQYCVLDDQTRSVIANAECPGWCPIKNVFKNKKDYPEISPKRYNEILESVRKNPLYSKH